MQGSCSQYNKKEERVGLRDDVKSVYPQIYFKSAKDVYPTISTVFTVTTETRQSS